MLDKDALPALQMSTDHRTLGIDTIIRLHDLRLLSELDRALFSLYHQTHRSIRPIVVTQGFDPEDVQTVRGVVERYNWRGRGVPAEIVNVPNPSGADIRSALLNAGLAVATGRYVSILDADDYLYGNALDWLVTGLGRDDHAIAFGNIAIRHVAMIGSVSFAFASAAGMFKGEGLDDLLEENFCPIHSFVVDRTRVDPADLSFCEDICRLEDYDFLLRICSKYPANFATRSKVVGVYVWKSDGSNSTITGSENAAEIERKRLPWEIARRHVEATRKVAINTLSARRARGECTGIGKAIQNGR